MGKPHQFRQSDITRSIRATRAAGVEHFELRFDHLNRPIIRVGESSVPLGEDDAAAAIAEWVADAQKN